MINIIDIHNFPFKMSMKDREILLGPFISYYAYTSYTNYEMINLKGLHTLVFSFYDYPKTYFYNTLKPSPHYHPAFS